jgi:FlaA1/EpsC-like NDP-sugar epimerase
MSDRQLAKDLQARNVLAERIATVLRQRQKIGAERRTHECEYQRLNNDRALARYYRLSGGVVAQQVDVEDVGERQRLEGRIRQLREILERRLVQVAGA